MGRWDSNPGLFHHITQLPIREGNLKISYPPREESWPGNSCSQRRFPEEVMRAARLPYAGLGASHRHPSLLPPTLARYPFAEPCSGCAQFGLRGLRARLLLRPRSCCSDANSVGARGLRLALAQAKCQPRAAFVTRRHLQDSVPAPRSQSQTYSCQVSGSHVQRAGRGPGQALGGGRLGRRSR